MRENVFKISTIYGIFLKKDPDASYAVAAGVTVVDGVACCLYSAR